MPWFRSLIASVLCTLTCVAGDWPQWLGPTRNNATSEKVGPWKKPLRELWRKPVGEGNGTPVVADGRVFVHAKVKDKNEEEVVAFDAKSGDEIWRKSYTRPDFKSLFGNGPRSTPAVDNAKVYTLGITGLLTCLAASDGKQLWQKDILKQFNVKNLRFGVSCSPLIEGNLVLINVGGKGSAVVAFNKENGNVVWKKHDDGASYSSPIAFGKGKQRQVVVLTADGVISISPADGSLFWRFPLRDLLFESSTTPIRCGDILMASSITYGSAALRLQNKDGKPSKKSLWKQSSLTSYFSTPVAIGKEHIYMVTGTNPLAFLKKSEATLRCIEAKSGKELWNRPKVGKYHACLLRTGDQKLLMLEEAGDLVLVDPNPKKFIELARGKVCGETWAHPAIANGKLYVRDKKEVICLELR